MYYWSYIGTAGISTLSNNYHYVNQSIIAHDEEI